MPTSITSIFLPSKMEKIWKRYEQRRAKAKFLSLLTVHFHDESGVLYEGAHWQRMREVSAA